jgi:hypothetical protein
VTTAILHEFEAKGWIEVEYRGLVLRDPRGLTHFLSTAADEPRPQVPAAPRLAPDDGGGQPVPGQDR